MVGDPGTARAARRPRRVPIRRARGGAYNDRTIGDDTVESLQGGDFTCGDYATFLTQITVGTAPSDPSQTIELDFRFLADTTGQPGAAFADVGHVAINYGAVSNGAGPGGTDTGNADDGASTATLLSESLTGLLYTAGSELATTVRIDDLEAGEKVVLRMDVRIACDPGSSPTGNLQGMLEAGRVTAPGGGRDLGRRADDEPAEGRRPALPGDLLREDRHDFRWRVPRLRAPARHLGRHREVLL